MGRVTIERIVCPIDFSEFSRDALDHAVALASWYGATLTLMHVIEPVPIDGLAAGAAFIPVPDSDKVADDLTAFGQRAIGTADVPMDVLVTLGTPAIAIR